MEFSTIQQKVEREIQERGYSRKTQKTYLHQLRRFHAWCEFHNKSKIGLPDISEYKSYLASKGLKNSSVRSAVESIKFYEGQLCNRKKFLGLKGPKLNKPFQPYFTKDEVKRMIGCTNYIKHKLLLVMLYTSGVRVDECIRIKIEDIFIESNHCYIKSGKGNKDRIAPIGNVFIELFKQYLSLRKDNSPYLFNKGNSHITARCAEAIVNYAKHRAGIRKPGNCHALRRSFATHMHEMGVDIRDLKDMLGHSDLKTTIGYVKDRPDYAKLPNPADALMT